MNKVKRVLHYIKETTHNLVNDLFFCLNKRTYNIDQYKNLYKGMSCFVVGNGPSLLPEDLEIISKKGFITFAANKIYNIFDKTNWRPTFVSVSDYTFIQDKNILNRIQKIECKELFVRSQFSFDTRNNACHTCAIKTDASRKLLDNPKFSMDCNNVIYDIASVTYFNIQLAAYMGFETIYLIGMDNRYAYSKLRNGTIIRNEGVLNYFGEHGLTLPDPSKASPTWELDIAFEYADKFSRLHGFRIFNATRGGFLEKFERVNLDEILSEK